MIAGREGGGIAGEMSGRGMTLWVCAAYGEAHVEGGGGFVYAGGLSIDAGDGG